MLTYDKEFKTGSTFALIKDCPIKKHFEKLAFQTAL